MKEDLISFETAKLAEDKGFDNSLGIMNHVYDLGDNELYKNANRTNLQQLKIGVHYILAPTQSLLQKWLREEHKLHVCSDYWHSGNEPQKWGWSLMTIPLSGKGGLFKSQPVDDKTACKTYELALEKGLFEALKLIEI